MEEKICPCCSNRCPADQLSCGRGRAYFGVEGGEHSAHEHSGHARHGFAESSDEVVNLLLKCGHTLHHGHGDKKLDCLTDSERKQLVALLNKCLENL